jgi:predicted DNA-binding transcriptional regulator AlpA
MSYLTTDLPYLTREQLAARLHVSVRTLARLTKTGQVPKPIRVGRRLLYPVRSRSEKK